MHYRIQWTRLLAVCCVIAVVIVVGRWLVVRAHGPVARSSPPPHVAAASSSHHKSSHPRPYTLGGSTTPFRGDIYIADEAANRILAVNVRRQIVWTAHVPSPDDVNPTPDGGPLIVNADARQIVYAVSPKTGQILWTYGHLGVTGSAPGYLYIPEDSYGLPHGDVLMTDPGNERALVVNIKTGRILFQYGHTGVESIAPGYLYWTNNAVALPNGDVLITDGARAGLPQQLLMVSPAGTLVWHVTLPKAIVYPSDAMPVGPGLYALTSYTDPAGLYVVNQKGRIVWSYAPQTGPGSLNHASSINRLPNGNFLVSDDQNYRVIVIDPATHRIVWQYGQKGVSGTGPDQLLGNTDSKAAGEALPPYVWWEGGPRVTPTTIP